MAWKKIKEYSDGTKKYQNTIKKSLEVNIRWNPVTRKWQVFATDGSIEIWDGGNYSDRNKSEAIRELNKYMREHPRG